MLEHKISKIKNFPQLILDRQLQHIGKHRLLAEIGRCQKVKKRENLPFPEWVALFVMRGTRRLIPGYRVVAAASLIILLSISTGYIARAAVPGEPLWSVKISLENAEVALAVNSAQEGRIHIRHVGNRLKELNELVAQPVSNKKSDNISQLVRHLEKNITAAEQSLKITSQEKQDSDPQAVISLANDLTDKASEAVKILEENKLTLATEAGDESKQPIIVGVISTSTEALEQGDNSNTAQGAETELGSDDVAGTVVVRNIQDIITEVQLVNEYVSYYALAAMIRTVERRGVNRDEVTAKVQRRIEEQAAQLAAIELATSQISDQFLLQRLLLVKRTEEAVLSIGEAKDFVVLDNLSSALDRLNRSKDIISGAALVLREVALIGGIVQNEQLPEEVRTDAKRDDIEAEVLPEIEGATIKTVDQINLEESEVVEADSQL